MGEAPLVVVFERDDAIAVPLLTQLRLASYDVRSARTPVELFDTLQKHVVALVLVDLGNATASRREFWVALDAHRRGRITQVLTFRQVAAQGPFDSELELSPRALADLEISGPQDLPLLIEAVRQRVPLESTGLPGAGRARTPERDQLVGLAPLGPFGPVLGVPMRPGARVDPAYNGMHQGMHSTFDTDQSPFAHPAAENPFSGPSGVSPFAQPDSSNPFASAKAEPPYAPVYDSFSPGGAGYRPQGASSTGGLAATRLEPMQAPSSFSRTAFGGGPIAVPPYYNGHASDPGMPPDNYNGRQDHTPPGVRVVADAWVPPDGAVLADEPIAPAGQSQPNFPVVVPGGHAAPEWPTQPVVVPADSEFPTYDTHDAHADGPTHTNISLADAGTYRSVGIERSPAERSPAPEPSSTPASSLPVVASGALTLPEERALGAVLVEGALLTPRKLEVLKGIKSMLSSVEMDFKLGELALLFKFLSPDQLLAALLVSRKLVSPQQIAALGQIKQELARSGINYDLETLLVTFHIMSREELAGLRADLA